MKVDMDTTPKLSRVETAKLLKIHPDSVSRLLPEGLASAIVEWGGHGKTSHFSRSLAERFYGAWQCRQTGRSCRRCREVLEDCRAIAEHLIEKRHGYFQSCGDADCGPAEHELSEPCSSSHYARLHHAETQKPTITKQEEP